WNAHDVLRFLVELNVSDLLAVLLRAEDDGVNLRSSPRAVPPGCADSRIAPVSLGGPAPPPRYSPASAASAFFPASLCASLSCLRRVSTSFAGSLHTRSLQT